VKEVTQKDKISSLTLKAPAKINLFLKVLNRRPDGFHEIESQMLKIELFDILHLSRQAEAISLSCPGTTLPADQGNLVYRAAQAFFSATGIKAGIEIILEKNIPIAAGLGGGSSDAAAVVIGLNTLFNTDLGREQLMEIARPLGADVPFFMQGCSAAVATGIGDIIQQVEPMKGFSIVLVNPGFEVSTKWVYENFPLTSNSNPYILARGQKVTRNFHGAAPGLYEGIGNDLEVVTISRYPEIEDIKKELKKAGAVTSLMSGSGPTVFGLFLSEEDARRSFIQLSRKFLGNVFLARPYIP
jgi:4-diphosphocytidyl-2-C-methyl-D-erythritol kinase